jgi:hypothetical protein
MTAGRSTAQQAAGQHGCDDGGKGKQEVVLQVAQARHCQIAGTEGSTKRGRTLHCTGCKHTAASSCHVLAQNYYNIANGNVSAHLAVQRVSSLQAQQGQCAERTCATLKC